MEKSLYAFYDEADNLRTGGRKHQRGKKEGEERRHLIFIYLSAFLLCIPVGVKVSRTREVKRKIKEKGYLEKYGNGSCIILSNLYLCSTFLLAVLQG